MTKRASEPDLIAWAVEWHSRNLLDGERRKLCWNQEQGPGEYRLFSTRRRCLSYINETYGYIRDTINLRGEPHGWRLPRAMRVEVRRIG